MARETKVGLLAGLAFIICFAVILANRGRESPIAGEIPYLFNDSDFGRSGRLIPPREADRIGPKTVFVPPSAAAATEVSPGQRGSGDVVLSTGADPSQVDGMAPWSQAGHPVRVMSQASSPGLSGAGFTPDHGSAAAGVVPTDSPSSKERMRLADLGGPAHNSPTVQYASKPAPAAGNSPAAAKATATAMRKHTIAPGDTLSKIATAYYGTKSKAVVKAIYESNRSVLTSPDVLRAGVELALPPMDGRAAIGPSKSVSPPKGPIPPSAPAKEPPNGREPTPSKEPKAGPAQWYQVRKGDRYASIAREQLGDPGRWHELFELNKDKFPDPMHIREGVRIKLPPTRSADAWEPRR